MPVTIRPSPSNVRKNQDHEDASGTTNTSVPDAVPSGCREPQTNDPSQKRMHIRGGFSDSRIITSSFSKMSLVGKAQNLRSKYNNGFVDGLVDAFDQNRPLVIRPEEVWRAILFQLSFFVNGNAERLRYTLVAHDGKPDLLLNSSGWSICEIHIGSAAQGFANFFHDRLRWMRPDFSTSTTPYDDDVRWTMPDFSTSNTLYDHDVMAYGMLALMQPYFNYVCKCRCDPSLMETPLQGTRAGSQMLARRASKPYSYSSERKGECGLPSVTLLGTRHDWEMLADRVNKLHVFGEECKRWANLLQPIMGYMLRTFDEPDSQEVKDFWLCVAYEPGRDDVGSGVQSLSGWITAFAYFQENGKIVPQHDLNQQRIRQTGENGEYWAVRAMLAKVRNPLILGGVSYPRMSLGDVPTDIVMVPIKIIDDEVMALSTSRVIAAFQVCDLEDVWQIGTQ
ncbi:hypothetical protein F4777DRAFT_594667 [Nemania sp. FL0916]|nr:hypothetical protein F4777DRAFT_594667 [Nemania sp. FL0916]